MQKVKNNLSFLSDLSDLFSVLSSSPISERLRQALKKPQGILIKGDPGDHKRLLPELKKQIKGLRPTMISTIGDEVTLVCNQSDIPINLAIIDYKVARKKKYYSLSELGFTKRHLPGGEATTSILKAPRGWQAESASWRTPEVEESVIRVRNPSGHITRSLVSAVKKAIKRYLVDGKQRIIKVLGEEDLAGVPAILLSPLGSVVLYGQPGEGVVLVEITEKKKQELFELFKTHS